MANSRLTDSIVELDGGREPITQVVVLQQRPVWSLPVSAAVFLAVYFALQPLDLGAILRGAVAGGALGLTMAVTSTRWLLAGTPTRALLARAKLWSAGAMSIDAEYPLGVEMTAGRSFINATYTLDGRTFVVSRAHTSNLAEIATLT